MEDFEQNSQEIADNSLEGRKAEAKRLLNLLRTSEQKTPIEQFEFGENYTGLVRVLGVLNSMPGEVDWAYGAVGTSREEMKELRSKIIKEL
jgi:hypothetical protein